MSPQDIDHTSGRGRGSDDGDVTSISDRNCSNAGLRGADCAQVCG